MYTHVRAAPLYSTRLIWCVCVSCAWLCDASQNAQLEKQKTDAATQAKLLKQKVSAAAHHAKQVAKQQVQAAAAAVGAHTGAGKKQEKDL